MTLERLHSRRGRRLWRRFWTALLAIALVTSVACWLAPLTPAVARTQGAVPSSTRVLPAEPADSGGYVVGVGMHVRNMYDLSLVDQSFLAEGWYWYDWGQDVQSLLERLKINPDDLLELSNEIELGQYSSQQFSPASETVRKPGRFGRIVRFSGKFYLEDVPQRYAPFDAQDLTIGLEVKPEALAIGSNRIRLEPLNRPAALVGESAEITGYELQSVAWRRNLVVYPDEFIAGMKYSRLTAVFKYGKNHWSMFLKWIFPVLVVMAIVVVSPSIEGVLGDLRLAIPPSAVLTLVVMQDSYKNSFPPAPYLTYLDELYVYCYIVCLAIFLLFLAGTNVISRAREDQCDRVVQRVNTVDTLVQLSLVAGFVFVGVVGWFT